MTYSGNDMSSVHSDAMNLAPAASQLGQAMALISGLGRSAGGSTSDRAAESSDPAAIVSDEVGWRLLPTGSGTTKPRIVASRWESAENRPQQVSAETAADGYVVGLVLRPMDIRLSVAGRVVHDGVALPGMMHVSEPSTTADCLFRGPYDALHLHVPSELLTECGEHYAAGSATLLRSQPAPERDPIALQLGLSLLKAEEFGASFGWIYADGISLAIVTRLLSLQAKGQIASERSKVVSLTKWRLARATDYIEAHLDEPLSLADVAAASGLSRMHFAAQFKAATGCRPHDYVLRRRIARAQELMAGSDTPLVDISLQVGFQSQAHFTTVFRRLVGQPPHAWRQSRNA